MPIRTASEYIESLRDRKLRVYLFGELVDGAGRPPDHPPVDQRGRRHLRSWPKKRPSWRPRQSTLTGQRVNRFLAGHARASTTW